jgi:hypothetical protein
MNKVMAILLTLGVHRLSALRLGKDRKQER